ncbi:putative serine/threonine protein kinase [Plesiocystis pacifica SIR-1]|uniref:Putative serine/threonine protein kinase n=2 Tax=Plesiocystis pacifica TaxID=191768 RepID=A6G4H8_9BACT|nr:putative serine/threonine protein kinase [Plesiocystis pacifica SIR-1]
MSGAAWKTRPSLLRWNTDRELGVAVDRVDELLAGHERELALWAVPLLARAQVSTPTTTELELPLTTLDDASRGQTVRARVPRTTRLKVGMRSGAYELCERIGEGGMGEVFGARHLKTGARVALKTLSVVAAPRLVRFKREYRALEALSHPNLVELGELVIGQDGHHYFTMELVDGEPFVAWVRRGARLHRPSERARLERALGQLLEGVAYLHANAVVHRDLKPANVLVTEAARVVILDFGLVAEQVEDGGGLTREGQPIGTPRYMSPEQAKGLSVGPAADIYAVGVMLFQCLTGRLPYEGTGMAVMLDKQFEPPPELEDCAPLAPRALRALCQRMLARDPAERPSAREALDGLRGGSRSHAVPKSVFVGRGQELSRIGAVVAERRAAEPGVAIVRVAGPSGGGKSHLCREFRRRQRASGVLVFHGRCRQQETVPYKGLDAIVDALSVYLRRLDTFERDRLCPREHVALVGLFPVLDELWARGEEPSRLEPVVRRRLGFAGLRELLLGLSRRAQLVVHIDDFQWADRDTVEVLEGLCVADAQPNLMLLISHRSGADELARSEALRGLFASEGLSRALTLAIDLSPLSFEETLSMARSLLGAGQSSAADGRAQTIAVRSQGNPFLVTQLVAEDSDEELSGVDPDVLVARRLARLEPESLELLTLVAVFGAPLPLSLARTLGAESWGGRLRGLIEALSAAQMVVRARAGGELLLETAHDRVREVVLEGLDDRASLHWRVGQTMRAERRAEALTGTELFAVADQLEAGLDSVLDRMTDAERSELASLQHRAGEQSLASGAWSSARRFLRCARRLLSPKIAEAEAGAAADERSVAVCLALARAEYAQDAEAGIAIADAMLGWELAPGDLARVIKWAAAATVFDLSGERGLPRVFRGARRVGLRVPAEPSFVRAMASLALGGVAVLRSRMWEVEVLPQSEDPQARAQADVLGALLAISAFASAPALQAWSLGRLARAAAKHCTADNRALLCAMGMYITAASDSRRTPLWSARLLRLTDALQPSSLVAQLSLVFRYSHRLGLSPLSRVLPEVLEEHAKLIRVAPQPVVEVGTLGAIAAPLELFITPAQLRAIMERARPPTGQWVVERSRILESMWEAGERVLEDGAPIRTGEELTGLPQMVRIGVTARALVFHVAFAQYADARRVLDRLPRRFHRVLIISAMTPLCALAGVIAEIEASGGRLGAGGSAVLRRYRRASRGYGRLCPTANGGFCHMLVEAEIAAARGRHQQANQLYERAREGSAAEEMHFVAGLAAHRHARNALRCGQSLTARAAFDAAVASYTAHGAVAVVQVIEAERAAAGF